MAIIIGLVWSFSLLSQLFRLGTPFSGWRFIYRLAIMLSLSQITLTSCFSTWLAWVGTFPNSHYCFRTPSRAPWAGPFTITLFSLPLSLPFYLFFIRLSGNHWFLFLFHRKCLALSHANTRALEFGEKKTSGIPRRYYQVSTANWLPFD